jgi:hypothetical protein
MAIIALVRGADAKQREPQAKHGYDVLYKRNESRNETIRISVGALADTVDGVRRQVACLDLTARGTRLGFGETEFGLARTVHPEPALYDLISKSE